MSEFGTSKRHISLYFFRDIPTFIDTFANDLKISTSPKTIVFPKAYNRYLIKITQSD